MTKRRTLQRTQAIPLTTPSHPRTEAFLRSAFRFDNLLLAALLSIVAMFTHRPISDPDIGWHLRNAEVLVHTHAFLRHDLYSFTAPGAPWTNHEWLAELPYYFAWRAFGHQGLYCIMLALLLATFGGLFLLATEKSGSAKAAFLATVLAAFFATVSFGPRTLLFGWALLVLELLLLARFRRGPRSLWLLPPLFAVWVNTHGSWLIGMALLGAFFLCGLPRGASGLSLEVWRGIESDAWTRREIRQILQVAAASVAALFLNPYGWRLVAYPFDLAFRQKLNIANIEEWRSLDFHPVRGKLFLATLAFLLLASLLRRRRWKPTDLAFLSIGVYSALVYSRFLFLAAILLAPLLARELVFLPAARREKDRPWVNALFMAGLLTMCLVTWPRTQRLTADDLTHYPAKALPYLANFHPQGPVFNEYDWGGHLIWHYRQIPVFVDSRVDLFERSGVFADYLKATRLDDTFAILDRYRIHYVLFPQKTPLAYLLAHSPAWHVLYQDDVTVLFERNAEKQ